MDIYTFLIFNLLIFLSQFLCILSQDIKDVIGHYEALDIMVLIKHKKFLKGVNDPKSDSGEYPVELVEVNSFYIDKFPVTNAQYWKFMDKKPRYKTDAEEKGWSWVFAPLLSEEVRNKSAAAAGGTVNSWWLPVKGAMWNKPEGPGSSIRDKLDYPVVHISKNDAIDFCHYHGKMIPSEEQWEAAARGSLSSTAYPWGEKYQRNRSNLWQGKFPHQNYLIDGWLGISPVHAFIPQNDYGLFDLVGNVWEWTKSLYFERIVPRELQDKLFVVKGGSYLDTRDGSANRIARTGQRMGLAEDYTAHNVGFRCIKDAVHYRKKIPNTTPKPGSSKKIRPPRLHKYSETAKAKKKVSNFRTKYEL